MITGLLRIMVLTIKIHIVSTIINHLNPINVKKNYIFTMCTPILDYHKSIDKSSK